MLNINLTKFVLILLPASHNIVCKLYLNIEIEKRIRVINKKFKIN